MRSARSFPKVYLHLGKVDFRKQAHGLALLVQQELRMSPMENALFVFVSKDRRRMRILYWDESGFALWYKLLEKERFPVPKRADQTLEIDAQTMDLILRGYDVLRSKPHEKIHYERYS